MPPLVFRVLQMLLFGFNFMKRVLPGIKAAISPLLRAGTEGVCHLVLLVIVAKSALLQLLAALLEETAVE